MGRLTGLPSALVTDDSALGGFTIERSLRFTESSNTYLSRTFTGSSYDKQKKWTWSAWVKFGNNYNSCLFSGSPSCGGSRTGLYLNNGRLTTDVCGVGSYDESVGFYRDTDAWYHIVWRFDTTESTASDRSRIYVNGTQIAMTHPRTWTQNVGYGIGKNELHTIGVFSNSTESYEFDGYMAEINFVSELSLDASHFGYTDFQSKKWRPKKYTGSYNTTGFHLDFLDNSAATATTLGKDTSGQGCNWTPNNFVVSDSVLDAPSNNFATWRVMGTPVSSGFNLEEGNLYCETGSSGSARQLNRIPISSYQVNSGKWYMEMYHVYAYTMFGVAPYQIMIPRTSTNSRYVMIYSGDGNKYINTNGSESNSTYGANNATNNIVGILLDMDQTTPVMYVSYNGQWANGSGSWNQANPYTSGGAIPLDNTFFRYKNDSALSDTNGREGYCGFWSASAGGGTSAKFVANFGQDSTFRGRTSAGGNKDSAGVGDFKYAVPDGALALCSNNLSRVDNQQNTTSLIDPKKHFDVVTWSANSSTSNRKISGLEFQPDFVWTKTRNHTYHHALFDSNRGPSNRINADRSEAENTTNGGYLASFDHDGFTWQYGGGSGNEWWNESGKNYAAFCWKAGGTAVANNDGDVTSQVSVNDEAGFSIVKFTFPASGDAFAVGHGLGKIPELIIMKNRSHNNNWDIYHHGNGGTPQEHRLRLNTNDGRQDATAWNDTTPTSTVFRSRTSGNWYNANSNAIAYCWYSIPGYSAFGCYEGSGQSDGPYIYTGFRPAMIILKSYSNSGASYTWFMCDSTRGPRNNIYQRLEPNTTNSEVTDASNPATVDFYSDGFKLRGTGSMLNGNTVEYVYMAWAEQSSNTPYASEPNAR